MAKLFVSDPEFHEAAPGKARIWGISDQKTAKSLAELAKIVNGYKELDELVLFFHGMPGGITFEQDSWALSDPAVAKAFAKTAKIGTIRFEGCWVGEAPDEMAIFGKLFQAKKVCGFTWTSYYAMVKLDVPEGVTEDTMRKALKEQERWFSKGTSIKQLVAMRGTQNLLLEWFQADLLGEEQPWAVVNGRTNFDRLGRHKFRTRAEATDRTVTAAKAVRNQAVPAPFEYVTVTL
jgi:hypothetical protein